MKEEAGVGEGGRWNFSEGARPAHAARDPGPGPLALEPRGRLRSERASETFSGVLGKPVSSNAWATAERWTFGDRALC